MEIEICKNQGQEDTAKDKTANENRRIAKTRNEGMKDKKSANRNGRDVMTRKGKMRDMKTTNEDQGQRQYQE